MGNNSVTALTVVSGDWTHLLPHWSARATQHAVDVALARVGPPTPFWKWEALLALRGRVLYIDADLWVIRSVRAILDAWDWQRVGMVIDQGIYCPGSPSNVHQRFTGGDYCNAGCLLIDMGNDTHRRMIEDATVWLRESTTRSCIGGSDAWFLEQTAICIAAHRSGLYKPLQPGMNYMPHVTQSGPPPETVYCIHAAGFGADKLDRLSEWEQRFT